MKIAFLSLRAREPLAYGIMSLAAVLRRDGHEVSLVLGNSARDLGEDRRVVEADVLGMSATTGLHRIYVQWARALRCRHPEKIILLGGPHPTFFPEVIEQAPFDGVCIGEAEESLPELLRSLPGPLDHAPDGWWVRADHGRGPLVKGGYRAPPRDLDALPLPAFDLFYDRSHRYRRIPIRPFMATRGCPYRCTYCFNRTLNDLHRGSGPVVRLPDPEKLVDDILKVHLRWGGKLTWFLDANFASKSAWLEAFTPIYKRRVGLPFFCKLRPERATERTVARLAEGGCTAVGIGIESGSERLRREVLDRKVSDAAILEGCRRLKARGIRLLSFNMLGIPGETLDDALRTVALNVACGVDYAGATILQPYPGSEIAKIAIERGDFDGDFDRLRFSYFDASPLRFSSRRDRDRITNLQRVFSLAVELPEVRRFIRRIIDRPPVPFLDHLFKGRHDWAMQRTFYRAFDAAPPRSVGRQRMLARAERELGLR